MAAPNKAQNSRSTTTYTENLTSSALRLLIEHQHDTPASEPAEPAERDVAAEPEPGSTAKPGPGAELEPDPEADDHRSLEVTMPPGLDVRAARPKVVLHFHLSDGGLRTGSGLVRPEHGGPTTLDEFVEFLGRTGCTVNVQPVLDPTAVAPVDGYEVPQRLRAAVRVQQSPTCFPSEPASVPTWIWTTPRGMCRWITAGRRAKPGAATSARSPDPDTGRPPTAAGPNTNPNPATSCTAHRSATSTSSPTKAPSPSATPHSATPSGKPPYRNRQPSPPSYFEPPCVAHHGQPVRGRRATAIVARTEPYEVALDWSSPILDGTCTCPDFTEGEFCKHLVCLGLALLDRAHGVEVFDERAAAIDQYLDQLTREELVELIRRLVARDPGAADLVRARRLPPATTSVVDADTLAQQVSAALSGPRFVDYRASYGVARIKPCRRSGSEATRRTQGATRSGSPSDSCP